LFNYTFDILFLSETWLLNSEIFMLKNFSNFYDVKHSSSMPFRPTSGRPYGGNGIIYNKNLKVFKIEFLNDYLCYIDFKKNNTLFLLIFVHLPFDDHSTLSLSNYNCLLTLINNLNIDFSNIGYKIFISGDFNCDFSRNNRFDKNLLNFINSNSYQILNNYSNDYSYENGTYRSYIDHCLKPLSTEMIFTHSKLIENDNNNSDHKPLLITSFFEGSCDIDNNDAIEDKLILIHPNLKDELILKEFQSKVTQIYNENNRYDNKDINLEYEQIVNAITSAYNSMITIITKASFDYKNKFWFNDELKQLKKKKQIYKINNRNDFDFKENLKKFKKESRKIQRRNIKVMSDKKFYKLEKLRYLPDKDKFWRSINKFKKGGNDQKDVSIDPNTLFDHYFGIFGSANTNKSSKIEDIKKTNTCIDQMDYNKIEINEFDFEFALRDTKNSNVCGPDGISSIMLKNCSIEFMCEKIFPFFSKLFSDGIFPVNFNCSFIKSILKDYKKATDSLNNIRPISISNVLSQIFERILLSKMPELRKSSDFQFNYKTSTSCTHALFAVKECIFPYLAENKLVFGVTLDVQKAFDSLWRDALYSKLLDTFSPKFVILLKRYYNLHKSFIKTESVFPKALHIINGVKQGGVISPFLYNYFINDLIVKIDSLKLGLNFCDILNLSISCFADDTFLISDCLKNMQLMLDMCDDYGIEFNINYNPNKTYLIVFSKYPINNSFDCSLSLSNIKIKRVDSINYLGYKLNYNLDCNQEVMESFKIVKNSFFSLYTLGMRPNGLNPFVQSFIYKTFCLSKFLYGLEVTSLNKTTLKNLNVEQNMLIRYAIGLHKNCHMSDLLVILKIFNIQELYTLYKLIFIKNVKNNKICNTIFEYLCKNFKKYSNQSPSLAKDLKNLTSFFNVDISFLTNNIHIIISKFKADTFAYDKDNEVFLFLNDCLNNINTNNYRKQLNTHLMNL
jgi:hypothetical protein